MVYTAMAANAGDIEQDDDDDDDLPLGIVVGASVGGVMAIIALVIICLLLMCYMHK